MTDREADEKFERLSEQIDNLPDHPPVVVTGTSRAFLATSLVQLAFVVLALVGTVVAIGRVQDTTNRIENNRVESCVKNNQFRKDVAAVLFDASKTGAQGPAATEFFNRSISRFSLTNCLDPNASSIPMTADNVTTKSTRSNP